MSMAAQRFPKDITQQVGGALPGKLRRARPAELDPGPRACGVAERAVDCSGESRRVVGVEKHLHGLARISTALAQY